MKAVKPVEYHCYDSCNKCAGVNDVTVTDSINGQLSECKTKCIKAKLHDKHHVTEW